jgi:hypothetical protein
MLTVSVALNLDDHLLEAPNSLLAALLGDLFGQVLASLLAILLSAALL